MLLGDRNWRRWSESVRSWDGHVWLMQPAARTTTRGFLTVSADALEILLCSTRSLNYKRWHWTCITRLYLEQLRCFYQHRQMLSVRRLLAFNGACIHSQSSWLLHTILVGVSDGVIKQMQSILQRLSVWWRMQFKADNWYLCTTYLWDNGEFLLHFLKKINVLF